MTDWRDTGSEPMSDAQRRMLNAVCGDLAKGIDWHGEAMTKDDWRHFLCAHVLGERLVQGIRTGEGHPGLIRFSRSSKELTRSQAAEAITMGLQVGDHPDEQWLDCPPVRWCDKVLLGTGLSESDLKGER